MKYFILIDIETTGLSPNSGCEITEIGALKVCNKTLEIKDEFSCLIDIDGDVPFFISKLTGITKSMLVNKGIHLDVALAKLANFSEDLNVYAHNSNFDKKFIRYYLEKRNIKYIASKWVDTIQIFKEYLPGRKTYKLESLIKDYQLAEKEDHRAISDAKHTLSLLSICKSK